MTLTKDALLCIKDNYKKHKLTTGGNMTIPEQVNLLLGGKKLRGSPYPDWAHVYCQLDLETNKLVEGAFYRNTSLLGEHYTITVVK